jgi:alkanesulfonate monooxygenase
VASAARPPDRKIDQMVGGRLNINIISSDMPGQELNSGPRYQRTLETMKGLRTLRSGDPLEPVGGFSEAAKETAAAEAREAADRLISKLDAETGAAIRGKSLDAASVGVQHQADLRGSADDDGYAASNLWTGIGRARSGAGAALVGDPDQIAARLREYRDEGVEAFILSGYPHIDECELVARHVLPAIDHEPLKPRF